MGRFFLTLVASQLVLLSGCAQPPAEANGDDFVLDAPLSATEDTGIIRGIVVDSSIVPVMDATISIASLDRVETSNEHGAFGFSNVPPGSYFLNVERQGFAPTQLSVEVEAGEENPPIAKVQLQRDASTTPYHTPYQFRGFMKCSLSYIALCGAPVVDEATGDNFLATFELAGPPTWINMESVWEGTQPTGNQMNLNMGRTPAGPSTTCCAAQGPSPLLVQANATTIAESGIGTEGDLIGRMFSWEMAGTGIDDHTGMCIYVVLTTYCQGPGVTLEQEFELFVHAFYHYAPPAEWRFTENPDVPSALY